MPPAKAKKATPKKKVVGQRVVIYRTSFSDMYVHINGHEMDIAQVARALGIRPKALLKLLNDAPEHELSAIFTAKLV